MLSGFPIERSADMVNLIYEKMVEDEENGIKTNSDDRKGLYINSVFWLMVIQYIRLFILNFYQILSSEKLNI